MTNMQSGYNDLFSSWFSESWSPFSQSGLDLEEFVVDVIIPVLLLFWMKELIDFGFQVYWILNLLGVKPKADAVCASDYIDYIFLTEI